MRLYNGLLFTIYVLMLGVSTLIAFGLAQLTGCTPILLILAPLCFLTFDAAIRATVMIMWAVVVMQKPVKALPSALQTIEEGTIDCLLAVMRKHSVMPSSTKDVLEKMIARLLSQILP